MIDYKSTIKVVGFDLDQTLFPKSPEIDEAIQKYIYEKIAAFKGISISDAATLFRSYYKDGAGLSGTQTVREIGLPNASEIIQEALERADIAKFLHENKEVVQLLNDLKNRYEAVDLITGSTEKTAHEKLKKLHIPFSLFNKTILGDQASKSEGDAYKLWLSYYPNFKPDQFLYIGDRVRSDYEVPKTFGIQSLLVNIAEIKNEVDCPQLRTLTDIREILL